MFVRVKQNFKWFVVIPDTASINHLQVFYKAALRELVVSSSKKKANMKI